MAGVVIVGGGQAAASLATQLRAHGHDRPFTIICEEPFPPYQRPPLSKGYLLGDMEREQLFLKPRAWYEQEKVDLRLGTRVDKIDRDEKCVRFGDGSLTYDQLVLATGSLPRSLPETIGGRLNGVHTVRNLADIDALAPQMRPGRRLVIVGGGYIGLEAAAVARKLGLNVTLIEAAPRILQRVASPETADYIRELHTSNGVTILEGMSLERLVDMNGWVTGICLANGDLLSADLVIVGIGVVPATSLAEDAGLRIDNGIAVDEYGRTSDPTVWAAGDCASFPTTSGRIRLESVGNAIDQAKCIASNILGTATPYAPKPWFWSDQYDVKLQIAGLNTGYDRVVTRSTNAHAKSFWYFAGGRLLAVDAANDPGAYMAGKRIIETGKTISPEQLKDVSYTTRELLSMAVDPD
jgi:3-phenylpropionate/trans-cinnamate dioxygenase ferredoxin reductase subunit